MSDIFFKNRKLVLEKLLAFGFVKSEDKYIYSTKIANNQFKMIITILAHEIVCTKVVDCELGEEYVLHQMPEAVGSFVGLVRTDYENILKKVAQECFDKDVFKSDYAHKIIKYIRDTYNDELEYLWQRFPNNAIFRRKDTGKWYGALLVISKNKLGIDSNEIIDILDLRMNTKDIEAIVDNKKYYPGYHMNKKHWVTICLDGSVPIKEILQRIDTSYELAIK